MTRAEAVAEARKRWGPTAEVCDLTGDSPSGIRIDWKVEIGEGYSFHLPHANPVYSEVKGTGRSWKEALTDADERQADDVRRYHADADRRAK